MLACGFLTELLPADQLRERAAQLAGTIAGLAPIAVQGMKRHLNAIARGDLDTAALAEDIRRATQSEDIREGALAWKEKRKPAFTGK
jgi:enoyl-CoA hydratase/carnithine racemase